MRDPLSVVVLAAGQGTRMRSRLPKVLQPLAGRTLLTHVLDTALALQPDRLLVVYGHGGEDVIAAHPDHPVSWIHQPEQLGTGHAVGCALSSIPDEHRVLVLCGDVPLTTPQALRPLAEGQGLGLLTATVDDPSGYGRILRDDQGRVCAIREERDADVAERSVCEVNTGLLAAPAERLRDWLGRLSADNQQGEYYLTDIVGEAVRDGDPVEAVPAPEAAETVGINDPLQLAEAERIYQARAARDLLARGLRLTSAERMVLRGELAFGYDCRIDPDCLIEGRVELGDDVRIGQGVILRNARIEDGAEIEAYSVVEDAEIGAGARVGPFAHLRRGTALGSGARIGNFVETKNATLGAGAKANHLTYVGDAEVGAGANLGAGTITCNYDGAHKHRTRIGEQAFIGSGSQLVAPVAIGARATIGAGTTVTRDAAADALTVGRCRTRTIPGWLNPGLTSDHGPEEDS